MTTISMRIEEVADEKQWIYFAWPNEWNLKSIYIYTVHIFIFSAVSINRVLRSLLINF